MKIINRTFWHNFFLQLSNCNIKASEFFKEIQLLFFPLIKKRGMQPKNYVSATLKLLRIKNWNKTTKGEVNLRTGMYSWRLHFCLLISVTWIVKNSVLKCLILVPFSYDNLFKSLLLLFCKGHSAIQFLKFKNNFNTV